MHSQHLEDMLFALRPVLKNRTKARAILERYWASRIAIVWTTEQVHRAANEQRTALKNREARDILRKLLDSHNAQYGLNWETLANAIGDSGKGRDLTKADLKRFIEQDVITIQPGERTSDLKS